MIDPTEAMKSLRDQGGFVMDWVGARLAKHPTYKDLEVLVKFEGSRRRMTIAELVKLPTKDRLSIRRVELTLKGREFAGQNHVFHLATQSGLACFEFPIGSPAGLGIYSYRHDGEQWRAKCHTCGRLTWFYGPDPFVATRETVMEAHAKSRAKAPRGWDQVTS